MIDQFDVCIIGSGAGGGPVALSLSRAGFSVLLLEKGPWFKTDDFYKDELAAGHRSTYTSNLHKEPHVIETEGLRGWEKKSTAQSGQSLWNGNCVGGATNFMSGSFYRLKPVDFKLRSTFGAIAGANIADWPISYDDLEPYYKKVEHEVGVSGQVILHSNLEPRSSPSFPFPPLQENPVAKMIDQACHKLGYQSLPTARAIISRPRGKRISCAYSGYCGGYGCATDAKGSSRVSLLTEAVETGKCTIIPHAMASFIHSDDRGKIAAVTYRDKQGIKQKVGAQVFVIACQPIETARLLLLSKSKRQPLGLANSSGQVGKNLLFAGGGVASGKLLFKDFDPQIARAMKQKRLFINRCLQDDYILRDKSANTKMKGGTIQFTFRAASPIAGAQGQIFGADQLVWGAALKSKIYQHFNEACFLKVETFCDWLPVDDCFVTLDDQVKDIWGSPVAKVRIMPHPHNLQIGWYLAAKGAEILEKMGAKQVMSFVPGMPPTNLVAGTCRFGRDPKTSVLNPDCRAHDIDNLYITDASAFPTGGSVPYTMTIMANAFRVADKIIQKLRGG